MESENYRCLGYLGIAFQPDGCGVCLNMVDFPDKNNPNETNIIYYLWHSAIPLFEELKAKTTECMTALGNYMDEKADERKSLCSAKVFLVSNNSSTSKILESCEHIRGKTRSATYFYDVKPVAPEAEALAFVSSAINSSHTKRGKTVDLEPIKKEIESYKETQRINGLLATLSFSIGECEYQKNIKGGHDVYTQSEKLKIYNSGMMAALNQFGGGFTQWL